MADPSAAAPLHGKVAIVTGSARENGLGAGISLALASAGARVVINHVSDSSKPRAQNVLAHIEANTEKGRALIVQADISTVEGAKSLVESTLKGFGVDHIDILVNNAAAIVPCSFLDMPSEALQHMFQVDVFGAIYMIQAAAKHMPAGGRIINIGSAAGKLGLHLTPGNAIAKASLDAVAFTAARELGHGKGITINTVAPGPMMTDSMPPDNEYAMMLKDHLVGLTRAAPRVGTTEDIADVVLFLASEKSRWITGQYISASGGITGP